MDILSFLGMLFAGAVAVVLIGIAAYFAFRLLQAVIGLFLVWGPAMLGFVAADIIWESGHDNVAVLVGIFVIPVGFWVGFRFGAPLADKIGDVDFLPPSRGI